MRRLAWRLAAVLGLPVSMTLMLLAIAQHRADAPSGAPLTAIAAPPLVLTDDRGDVFDLARQRGRLVLVTFGYTRCANVCPATLSAFDTVSARLGADRSRVLRVFVTLDPAHDTPASLRGFLAHFAPTPLGLTGSPEAIAEAARAWGVRWHSAGGAFIDHTETVSVVGPDGRERLRYGLAELGRPEAVARDLEQLLHAS